jgi:hypothetical protein
MFSVVLSVLEAGLWVDTLTAVPLPALREYRAGDSTKRPTLPQINARGVR